jgi:hypothetical protein
MEEIRDLNLEIESKDMAKHSRNPSRSQHLQGEPENSQFRFFTKTLFLPPDSTCLGVLAFLPPDLPPSVQSVSC